MKSDSPTEEAWCDRGMRDVYIIKIPIGRVIERGCTAGWNRWRRCTLIP